MMFRRHCLWAGLGAALAGAGACGDDTVTLEETAVLADIANIVARPSYAALKKASDALKAAVAALGSADEAKLAAAQDAWKVDSVAWNHTRTFGFGPAKDNEASIRWKLGCDREAVEANIAKGDNDFSKLGASEKGLPTLEYLLFDPEGGSAAILAKLTDATSGAARVAHLVAASDALAGEMDTLISAWNAYADEMASAGSGSQVFKSPKDAMDALYNQVIYVADLAIDQINEPLAKTGKVAPELEDARLADYTIANTTAQIAAIRAVFEGDFDGKEGAGLADLLRERSADLETQFRDALAAADTALSEIPPPFRTALVAADTKKLTKAVDTLREIKRQLNADIHTALGVTISFTDMDGD